MGSDSPVVLWLGPKTRVFLFFVPSLDPDLKSDEPASPAPAVFFSLPVVPTGPSLDPLGRGIKGKLICHGRPDVETEAGGTGRSFLLVCLPGGAGFRFLFLLGAVKRLGGGRAGSCRDSRSSCKVVEWRCKGKRG